MELPNPDHGGRCGPLKDLNFVFTGRLERWSRSDAESFVESLGGRTPSNVSGNTDYVVAGPGGRTGRGIQAGRGEGAERSRHRRGGIRKLPPSARGRCTVVKLTFLGTRGEIKARTSRHHMHTSLRVSYRGSEVMVDCGADWLGQLDDLRPEAVFVTHAHPDHAWGLKEGAPCPVHATKEAWQLLEGYEIKDRWVVEHRRATEIEGMVFEAFPVEHSTRAPAVGYRISAGKVPIFYAPDVVYVHDRREALSRARLYVGDGATVTRSLVRKRNDALIGHAPIRTQLTWCQKEGVPRGIFTHCGSGLVKGDEEKLVGRSATWPESAGLKPKSPATGWR